MLKKTIRNLFILSLLISQPAFAFNMTECMKKAKNIGIEEEKRCFEASTNSNMREIQISFNEIANDEEFTALSKEELKRTYDAYMVYRKNYCKLYAVGQSDTYNPEYSEPKCIEELTSNFRLYMRSVTDGLYNNPE